VPAELRARGQRWTPQRQAVVQALARVEGHITGAELIEQLRRDDPEIVPSTVYRTLAALEEIGLVRHGHGASGREEFHVGADEEHGHLHCASCGGQWEIGPDETDAISALFAPLGFALDRSHVTIVGRCAECALASS
jgi:Fur family transcriptional regulator, ferric uptake regulator